MYIRGVSTDFYISTFRKRSVSLTYMVLKVFPYNLWERSSNSWFHLLSHFLQLKCGIVPADVMSPLDYFNIAQIMYSIDL